MPKRIAVSSRRLLRFTLLVLGITSVSVLTAAAAGRAAPSKVPATMLYEGYLADSNGSSIADGPYDFVLSLYAGADDPTPIWSEHHAGVKVAGGYFKARLGRGEPARPLTVAFDQPYFLGIKVGSEPEMTPRVELLPTAYAFRARTADEVADGSVTADKLAAGSVTDDKIASVAWQKITGIPGDIALSTNGKGPGPTPAEVWFTRGNLRTDPDRNYLGTADSTDLVLATDGAERMRIHADGPVEIKTPLTVDDFITSRKTPNTGGFFLADPQHGLIRDHSDNVRLHSDDGSAQMDARKTAQVSGFDRAAVTSDGGPVILDAHSQVQVSGFASGNDDSKDSYPLTVYGPRQGIAVQIGEPRSGGNNFVSFWDTEGMQGRIEGQTQAEYLLDPMTIAFGVYTVAQAVALGIALAVPEVDPSGVVSLAAEVVWDDLQFNHDILHMGVSYASGAGDYAEYLPRIHADEAVAAGDIVGVYGGKVSRATTGAQQILPISTSPIVLGNAPAKGLEALYEKVAFMGQVPVKVTGAVQEGDYIIPSGLEDGTGVAVAPEMMTAAEFGKVVGRAWTASDLPGVKLVNVAVGLNPHDVASLVAAQEARVTSLGARVDQLDRKLSRVESALSRGAEEEPSGGPVVDPAAHPAAAFVESSR